MIPLFKPYVGQTALGWLNQTLSSGYLGEGPRVKDFEDVLSKWLRTTRVLTVNSATSGLDLALKLVRQNTKHAGLRFLTTALTCTATNWPIINNGYWPTWVDVDPTTLNVDLDDLRSKLHWETAGIMLVHWAGRPHDMDAILQIQREFEEEYDRPLPIIEDCAHAQGASYKGKFLGTFGDYGVYSFQAVKPLTTGDGGCLITRSEEDYVQGKLLRWYGIDRDDREVDISSPGFKYHMNDVAASLGLANIVGAFDNIKQSMINAWMYNWAFHEHSDVKPLALPGKDVEHPYWLYTIKVQRRDDFIRAMMDRGVETSIVHKRNDHYGCMKDFRSSLPKLDSVYEQFVNIPVGWWVTRDDVEYILECMQKGW